jgi:DNA sulfur modification protein DndD
VIIHRVTLHNVGVYRGTQTIDLTPPDSEHPITLIGALNGGGKTTLLGSVQLALYGSRSKGIERTKKGYHKHLQELINREVSPEEGAAVEIEFERRIDGKPTTYKVKRAWRISSGAVEERVRVTRDGEPDALLADHWDESIDSFLPARLAHLFFFDGEQIERMADEEEATTLLSSAFQSLLGLDLVARLQEDLSTLERKKQISLKTPVEKEKLKILEEEVQKAQNRCEGAHQDLASITSKIEQKEKELASLRSDFKSKGGDVYLEREKLEIRRIDLTSKITDMESTCRDVASGDAPLLLVPDLLKNLLRQSELERTAEHQKIIVEAEIGRDQRVLKDIKELVSSKAYEEVRKTLERHRPESGLLNHNSILDISENIIDEIKGLINHKLPFANSELYRLNAEILKLHEERDNIDRILSSVPDADTLARIQHDIIKTEEDLKSARNISIRKQEAFCSAELELSLRDRSYQKEYESHIDNSESSEHDRRVVDRIPKVKETLERFRQRVVSRHIGSLENTIWESFQHLIRKPDLIGSVKIAKEDFKITLHDRAGTVLPFQILSAGERQLLATSILWALAKVSGRPVPLIIDTPLGRLDSHHRTHIVQRYFPVASHQVVLLSTDEEINGRYFRLIQPHVGKSYLINSPESCGSKIEEGYFPQNEISN